MTESYAHAATLGRIKNWYNKFGGHYENPAEHALKTLQETVELCLASGATPRQVVDITRDECFSQARKSDYKHATYEPRKVQEEIADLCICVEVHRSFERMDLDAAVSDKIRVLNERMWTVTQGGVLVRKGRRIL